MTAYSPQGNQITYVIEWVPSREAVDANSFQDDPTGVHLYTFDIIDDSIEADICDSHQDIDENGHRTFLDSAWNSVREDELVVMEDDPAAVYDPPMHLLVLDGTPTLIVDKKGQYSTAEVLSLMQAQADRYEIAPASLSDTQLYSLGLRRYKGRVSQCAS